MNTSDPDIFAAGDAVQTEELVTREPVNITLAGPGEQAGAHSGGQYLRAVRRLPRLAGNEHNRTVRTHGGFDGTDGKDGGKVRHKISQNDHALPFPRDILSGRGGDVHKTAVHTRRGQTARRADSGKERRRQTHRRARRGSPSGNERFRPDRARARLRLPRSRPRKTPSTSRGTSRRTCSAGW